MACLPVRVKRLHESLGLTKLETPPKCPAKCGRLPATPQVKCEHRIVDARCKVWPANLLTTVAASAPLADRVAALRDFDEPDVEGAAATASPDPGESQKRRRIRGKSSPPQWVVSAALEEYKTWKASKTIGKWRIYDKVRNAFRMYHRARCIVDGTQELGQSQAERRNAARDAWAQLSEADRAYWVATMAKTGLPARAIECPETEPHDQRVENCPVRGLGVKQNNYGVLGFF